MNVGVGDSVLGSHICFNALATLQNIKNVENSCNFCSLSDHSTYMCPVLSQGEHVKDTSIQNLSRSSVPYGLQVYENENGTHIISVQKFAKGCRFGPLLAPKSYIPIDSTKFPLTIFGSVNIDMDAMNMPELKDLFKMQNIYLDTRNEKYCNWMIHVDPAQYANEQNLIAYEEDNEIFFAAIEDLDVGDMLKVWYSPKYGQCMKIAPLCMSTHSISNNVLRLYCDSSSGVILPSQLFNNFVGYDDSNNKRNRTEISLPSIKNIIKPSSYVCYEHRREYNTLLPYYQTDNVVPFPSPTVIEPAIDCDKSLHMNNDILLHLYDSSFLSAAHNSDHSYVEHEGDDCEQNAMKPLSVSDDVTPSIDELMTSNSHHQQNGASDKIDDKKMYPCRLCDKKYSTMTNIYRHVRTLHNFFLCSLCMNMFKLETELKKHIHKCPKSDVKKPQCSVCMQYFSNSWSLTRHIKIHVSAGECDAEILMEKKSKEKISKDDGKDGIDHSDGEKNSKDSFASNLISLASEPTTIRSIPLLPALCDIGSAADLTRNTSLPLPAPIETSEHDASIDVNGNDNESSECIVCEKRFKSKSCLNKHQRSVHTAKVLNGVKRSASHNSHSKLHSSTAKRSQPSDSLSKITHTGSPVNAYTAKALASKLNERNNLMNGHAKNVISENLLPAGRLLPAANLPKIAINEIPVPPLIILQIPSATPSNRFVDMENGQQQGASLATRICEKPKFLSMQQNYSDMFESNLNVPTFNIFKKAKHENYVEKDVTAVEACSQSDKTKMGTKHPFLATEKLHKCDLCSKKFNKKYELKRHRAVHEYSAYTCPYCSKSVKREPSIIKHLRISHEGSEHIWRNPDAIKNLRHKKEISENNKKYSEIQCFAESTTSSVVNNFQSAVTLNNDDRALGVNNGNNMTTANKSKKSNFVNYNLKRVNLKNMKKCILKHPANISTDQIKTATRNITQTATAIKAPTIARHIITNDDDDGDKLLDANYHFMHENNQSHNVSSSSSSEIYKNIVLLNNTSQWDNTNANYNDNATSFCCNFNSNTPPSTPKTIRQSSFASIPQQLKSTASIKPNNRLHHNSLHDEALDVHTISMATDSPTIQKPLNTYRLTGGVGDISVNNIINNNYFFVDDDLSCNGVPFSSQSGDSPFSSHNHVDGYFPIVNSNHEGTMNKDLLTKFHDRLEEIEEKIDSTGFKALWNEMLDDDNLNDVDDDTETEENDDNTGENRVVDVETTIEGAAQAVSIETSRT